MSRRHQIQFQWTKDIQWMLRQCHSLIRHNLPGLDRSISTLTKWSRQVRPVRSNFLHPSKAELLCSLHSTSVLSSYHSIRAIVSMYLPPFAGLSGESYKAVMKWAVYAPSLLHPLLYFTFSPEARHGVYILFARWGRKSSQHLCKKKVKVRLKWLEHLRMQRSCVTIALSSSLLFKDVLLLLLQAGDWRWGGLWRREG